MTDTPPFYWLKGEDGPQELEDEPPPDGVLVARKTIPQQPVPTTKMNAQFDGITLNRNRDRQRHGYMGASESPDCCVDPSGMPGGGIRPPAQLKVPALPPPLMPANGNIVQRCVSIGPPGSGAPGQAAAGQPPPQVPGQPPGAPCPHPQAAPVPPPGGVPTPGSAPGASSGMVGLPPVHPSFYGGPRPPQMMIPQQQPPPQHPPQQPPPQQQQHPAWQQGSSPPPPWSNNRGNMAVPPPGPQGPPVPQNAQCAQGAQVQPQPRRGLACAPMQVQCNDNRAKSPAPNMRPRTASVSPWSQRDSLREHTPLRHRGEAQAKSNAFVANQAEPVPSGGFQKSDSFVAGCSELQSAIRNKSPQPFNHNNSHIADGAALSPMCKTSMQSPFNPALGPQGPIPAQNSYVGGSAAPSPLKQALHQGSPNSKNSYSAVIGASPNHHHSAPSRLSMTPPASVHMASIGYAGASRSEMTPPSSIQMASSGYSGSTSMQMPPNGYAGPPRSDITPSSIQMDAGGYSSRSDMPPPCSVQISSNGYVAAAQPQNATPAYGPDQNGRWVSPNPGMWMSQAPQAIPVAPMAMSTVGGSPAGRYRAVSAERRGQKIEVDICSSSMPRTLPASERSRVRESSRDGRAQSPAPSRRGNQFLRPSPAVAPEATHVAAPARPKVPPNSALESRQHAHGRQTDLRHADPDDFENRANAAMPRILITGASGLLGRKVLEAFSDYFARGLCYSRSRPNLIACDLTVDGEAARQIVEFRPQVVIHLAGQRRHDILRRSPANSRLLNVDASGAIAAACEYCSAWLIFVSADAVFDGSTPPYAETAQPNPLSEYGWHKLHAEKLVLAACPRAAILRLPLLYGPVESLDECLVTAVYEEMKNGRNVMDHCQRFYPTWTGDVAQVMRMMVELHLAGTDIHGVFHWQGQEQYTKYDIARVIASACGFEAPFAEASSSHGKWAPVADDVRLDCSRLQNLFAGMRIQPTFTSLQEGLRVCLSPIHGRDLMFLHNSAMPVTEPNLAAQIPAVVDAMCSKPVYPQDNFMHPPGSEPSTTLPVSPEGSGNRRSLRHTRQSAENVDPAKVNRADKQSHPGAQGDRHATRAAALKNIFREELELAWRRYRDAAVDGKTEEEFPSRAALAFLDRHN